MTRASYFVSRISLPSGPLLLLGFLLGSCDGREPLNPVVDPLVPNDSVAIPGDSVPAPPADTAVPPADSGGPQSPAVQHVGIPFGPWHLPTQLFGPEFTGGYIALSPDHPIADLEAARQTGTRILINLTNNERNLRDKSGFSMAMWKQRVDRFRGVDFSSYVADGTLIGHFIMDEPEDVTNWNGTLVSRSDIDEMARYSKELWPYMPTIIRSWPWYLKGYSYQYLDAAWAQYHQRLQKFGSVDSFIVTNVRDAQASGLNLITGLNLLAGGGEKSGLKGFHKDRYAMNATQVRAWGNVLLSQPYICAFLSWKYNEAYFSRPDIKAALHELAEKARAFPTKTCRR